MKTLNKIVLLFAIFVLAFAPTRTAFAKGMTEGDVIFGGSFTLKTGETHNGDLVIFGGIGEIQKGATFNGNLVLLGGNLNIAGKINGDVVLLGGIVSLDKTAYVSGDVVTMGAPLHKEEGATVAGEVVNGGNSWETVTRPQVIVPHVEVPNPVRIIDNPFTRMANIFVFSILMAGLALLTALFLPQFVERTGNALAAQPGLSGGLGLLTLVLLPFALVIMVLTIILIPVAFLAVVLLGVALVFGWLAIGVEVGQRFGKMMNLNWQAPMLAAFGTFLLTLILRGLNELPLVGWIGGLVGFACALMGLGAVVMTRFGSRTAATQSVSVVPASGDATTS